MPKGRYSVVCHTLAAQGRIKNSSRVFTPARSEGTRHVSKGEGVAGRERRGWGRGLGRLGHRGGAG